MAVILETGSGVTLCQVGVLSFLENAFSPEKLGFVLAIRATGVMQCFLVILHKELLLDRILRKKKRELSHIKSFVTRGFISVLVTTLEFRTGTATGGLAIVTTVRNSAPCLVERF